MYQQASLAVVAGVVVLAVLYKILFGTTQQVRKVMKISEIYIYPIKSLRPTQVSRAVATKYGFEYDRQFMLLQKTPDGYKNMAVSKYPEMTQFLTNIEFDESGNGTITVTFRGIGSEEKSTTLRVPLTPSTEKLEPFEVNMHNSPTTSFKMPSEYSTWFSECFGYEVLLVYLGENRRDVLFEELAPQKNSSLVSNIAKSVPLLGALAPENHQITFADCAPYLIVSTASLASVSSRLPAGEEMDMTKFRPNIVISGADSAWEEDYWRKVQINSAEIIMAHNCVRCKSINIDYATGKPGTGESGEVLKKLQKDRRIDAGSKWRPVFGRYSFLSAKSPSQTFRVDDEVKLVEVNKQRTVWSWPGLA